MTQEAEGKQDAGKIKWGQLIGQVLAFLLSLLPYDCGLVANSASCNFLMNVCFPCSNFAGLNLVAV